MSGHQVSHNRLSWSQSNGEFDAAMHVLHALKALKELCVSWSRTGTRISWSRTEPCLAVCDRRLGGNPVAETPALRYLIINYAPKLTRLDGLPVTEVERRGKVRRGCGA